MSAEEQQEQRNKTGSSTAGTAESSPVASGKYPNADNVNESMAARTSTGTEDTDLENPGTPRKAEEQANSENAEESAAGSSEKLADAKAEEAADAESDVVADAQMIALRAELEQAKDQLARSRADNYNLQQEYRNYVKRAKADVPSFKQEGRRDVLNVLLSVLDDLYAAEQAGELEGPFESIARKLENTLKTNFELERYGEVGEVFNPEFHEALMAQESADVKESEIAQILQPGYKLGEDILRATKVIVNNPA